MTAKNTDNTTQQSYRDRVATVDENGKRIWIYPRQPKGKFYQARTLLSVVLLTVLFVVPFLRWNGRPLVLLNFLERKFILFGIGFWPQDFHLFALALITFIVFIILFTVIFGRLFCGWVCPQTIFMEMLFRKIEYWIEGDANKQRKLNSAPWTFEKLRKKTLKHSIFYLISFAIANTFLSYIIGSDALLKIISEPVSQHAFGLIAILIFSFVFYWVFAFFREQVCTMVCPYGRLQGVLLDRQSIVVSYDFKRGEPRGNPKAQKSGTPSLGDCVDCGLCVEVCPTGIDIRDGTQLECINCTACIDACHGVMNKFKRPTGLIRYASYNEISERSQTWLNARVLSYATILTLLLGLTGFLLVNREPLETTILRTPGVLYQQTDDQHIQNIYSLQVINKSFEEKHITLKISNFPEAEIKIATGSPLILPADGLVQSVLFVKIPNANLKEASEQIIFEVHADGKLVEEFSTTFKTPINPI